MRSVDERALAEATGRRFRSEYDYAVFEYLRSGKVIQALERAGTRVAGRVLDDATHAQTLRRAGLARAAAFTWPGTARATLDVYRRVLGH